MFEEIRQFWNIYFNFHYGVAAAVGAFLFILCLAGTCWVKRKRGESVPIQEAGVIFLLCVYLTLLFGVTLLNRRPEESYSMKLMPFWSYLESLRGNTELGRQIFYNILAFVPLGIFFPVLLRNMRKLWRVALAAALLSGFIETSQLIFKCGLCELDDVINNTIGAVAGYALFKMAVAVLRTVKAEGRRRLAGRSHCCGSVK